MKKYLPLIAIVFLGLFLRFWQIDKAPPSLYWDEISQGYNAYSILKTGRDEHNEFLPVATFKAFGDYKAPVYIYLDVPFIGIFGKTTLGVRFPSALLGGLTVLLAYFLICELFYRNENRKKLALWGAFFLSISPWHIQLSRAAYEANVATFFTVLGIYLFFLAKRTRPKFFIFSITAFVLGFYSFNAHRVFIPLLGLLLAIIYFKDLLKSKKFVIISAVVGLVLLLPFIFYLRTPESKLRFNEVNIFSDINVIKESNRLIAQDNNSLLAKVLDNRRVLYSLSYVKHYFDFFNPTYLFFTGDVNPRFSLRDNGELFLWELPLLLIGAYLLISQKSKTSIFIVGWFLLSPVAGAVARETPHALRSETFIPSFEIIASLGMVFLIDSLKKINKQIKAFLIVVIAGIIVSSVYLFLHDYFIHFPVSFSYDWQYGYKEAVLEAEKLKNDYDYIVFTESYGRPYVYVAFYSDITPRDFIKEVDFKVDPFGFYSVPKLGKYVFRSQLIDSADKGKKVLYVGKADQIPLSFTILKRINFLNGDPAFVIAKS